MHLLVEKLNFHQGAPEESSARSPEIKTPWLEIRKHTTGTGTTTHVWAPGNSVTTLGISCY